MTTPQEIRRKYGLDDKLRVVDKQSISSQQVLLAEQLETKGIKRIFREMDSLHCERVGAQEFLNCIKQNNIPIQRSAALGIFEAYSKGGQIGMEDLKRIVGDAQPICERRIAEEQAQNIYNGCSSVAQAAAQAASEQLSFDEMILMARREFAERCTEKYHNKEQIMQQLYNADNTITRESLERFIAKMLPEMPEYATRLSQDLLDYQQQGPESGNSDRIPIAEDTRETRYSVQNELFEKAIFELLEDPGSEKRCQRRQQDFEHKLAEQKVKADQEETQIGTLYPEENEPQTVDSGLQEHEETAETTEPLALTSLEPREEKAEMQTADEQVDTEYRDGVKQNLRNFARQTSSAFDFAAYGKAGLDRSQSVAVNSRISLRKLEKNSNEDVLNMRVDIKAPCALPAYRRAFRNEKIKAAAALLYAVENSSTADEFEAKLFHFAPDVGLTVVKQLSEYARDPRKLAELTGLEDEMLIVSETNQFVSDEARRFIGNEGKLSQKCPCIPIRAETLSDADNQQNELAAALHNRSNNSELVHAVFGTKLGDGSNVSSDLIQVHPNAIPAESSAHSKCEMLENAYLEVSSELQRSEASGHRSRSAVHLSSRIRSGVSDVEERVLEKRSHVTASHDIFSYAPDPVPHRKYANSSVIGEVLRGERSK